MILSRTAKGLLISLAVAATLAACDRAKTTTDAASATKADAAAPGPLTYESKTPFAKVSLTLPEAIKAQPGLYKAVYDQEVKDLMAYAEGAQADRSEAGSDNLPPYEKTILYDGVVQTARLFSAVRSDFDYSGGAHPNTMATSLLWDKTTQKRISASDLFTKEANLTAVERALCTAVNAAKAKREGSVALTKGNPMWACPKLKDVELSLAPGAAKGKAGGLTFLINAYQVGPYSEGAYYLTLPLTSFQSLLNPTYAGEFGGTPTKAGDVTQDIGKYPA